MIVVRLSLLLIFMVLVSCGNGASDNSGVTPPPPVMVNPTLVSIQNNIFSVSCAVSGCHTGATPPEGLNLQVGSSFANLVGMPSVQVPGIPRVDPNNPDNSYLIQKLEGAAAVGARMPRTGPPFLTTDQINAVRQWISDGALEVTMVANPGIVNIAAVVPSNNEELSSPPAYISIAVNQELEAFLVNSLSVTLQAAGVIKVSLRAMKWI